MYIEKIGEGQVSVAGGLIHAILAFLEDQRLEPTPLNYSFAYAVMHDPAGPLAQEVARRTDGGIRLTSGEVEALGILIEGAAHAPVTVASTIQPDPFPPVVAMLVDPARPAEPVDPAVEAAAVAAALVVETRRQVAGFETMVSAMRSETRDFGRDLAASEDALRRSAPAAGTDIPGSELARIAAAMRARVEIAEARLEQATREASDLRRQLAEAHDDARRDPLTALPNRRAFEEALDNREDGPFHVAMCDVDHFKTVNDQHGHPVGDRVLKAIAGTLARECAGHLVARYGGEEFALLLGGIDAADAQALLEQARRAVGERRYRLRESDTLIQGITLSAGLVTILPGEALRDAIARADALLYAAKRQGRDRMIGEIC
ncbi:GGDEF domain-containing protein [Sphingomonas sp. 2R-10]|uniref:GGDEF domain-containing protein n=1 Tax=Sphingomonas sp. 2R-10 TaxID=3045148 RepID=UPI000F766CAB|nr:GGDEF domain-containing protein [Sphingomonas sp. 2R-10]MDJ0275242.1 GGDEF domain-containing protein [Sphingomonas sp. 2R-10]